MGWVHPHIVCLWPDPLTLARSNAGFLALKGKNKCLSWEYCRVLEGAWDFPNGAFTIELGALIGQLSGCRNVPFVILLRKERKCVCVRMCVRVVYWCTLCQDLQIFEMEYGWFIKRLGWVLAAMRYGVCWSMCCRGGVSHSHSHMTVAYYWDYILSLLRAGRDEWEAVERPQLCQYLGGDCICPWCHKTWTIWLKWWTTYMCNLLQNILFKDNQGVH